MRNLLVIYLFLLLFLGSCVSSKDNSLPFVEIQIPQNIKVKQNDSITIPVFIKSTGVLINECYIFYKNDTLLKEINLKQDEYSKQINFKAYTHEYFYSELNYEVLVKSSNDDGKFQLITKSGFKITIDTNTIKL